MGINIEEQLEFKTWQNQIRIKVQELTEQAQVRVNIIREGFRNE